MVDLSFTASINAHGTSPHFSSGLATKAAIDTEGCFAKVFSISIEEIFSPPDIITVSYTHLTLPTIYSV